MTSSELLMEGVELMVFGVGVVFSFLVLLVICINIMSWVVNRFFPEAAPVVAAPRRTAPHSVDPELLAVIGAAVSQHRARRKV